MGPREFRDQVVAADVTDLAANYGDLRSAYHAVNSVDALAAHIFVWCRENNPTAVAGLAHDSHYRQQLASQHPSFALLRDVAKAQKHVVLTQHNPSVSGSKATSVRELGWGEARWGEGRWGSPPQVVVQTTGGDIRTIESIVKSALEILDAELGRLGIP